MRKCSNFLNTYMEYMKEHEAPRIYHKWCALSLLSAIVRDNVFTKINYYTTYTNLYVLLVGMSGSGKGTSMAEAIDLYKEVCKEDRSTIYGCITPEQLIHRLATTPELFLQTNEFSVLIANAKTDGKIIPVFCDVFDGRPTGNDTKTQGSDKIDRCYFTLLGGSAPDLLEYLPMNSIGGGLTSRMMILFSDKLKKAFKFTLDPKLASIRLNLIEDLKHISKLKGKFTWDKKAETWFCNWIAHHNTEKIDNELLAGIHSRKPIYLVKIAMLLSIAESDSLMIKDKHLVKALKWVEEGYKYNLELLSMLDTTEFGKNKDNVYSKIKNKKCIAHSTLLGKVSRKINAKYLKDIIECLVQEKKIEIIMEEGKMFYKIRRV